MTMRFAELESEFAPEGLQRKLAEVGLLVQVDDEAPHIMRVAWDSEQKNALVQLAADFVFSDWQLDYITQRTAVQHPYLADDEREYVSLLTYHALRKTDGPIYGCTPQEWKNRIAAAFEDIFDHQPAISFTGVVRFRAKDYLSGVDEAIHEMVEHFLADREYEEFVSMLRYMLDAQPASSLVLHVYCTDERVWITDVKGELLRDAEVSVAAYKATDDGEVNAEDLAMSILITRSPCRIVIHDLTKAAPWPSFAETLERVFMDRASRCGGCSVCDELQHSGEYTIEAEKRSASPNSFE